MRKVAAATLAVPVIAMLYAGSVVSRAVAAARSRSPLFLGVAVLVAIAAFAAIGRFGARDATARPEARLSALPAAAFTSTVTAGTSPRDVVEIRFSAPMDRSSVEASIRVDPEAPVSLSWDATGSVLSVGPTTAWSPRSYHTITIPAGALQASGAPIAADVRASFLTRDATRATLAAIGGAEGSVGPGTTFRIAFDRPVEAGTLAVVGDPAFSSTLAPDPASDPATPAFIVTPDAPLAPGTRYTISLASGALDADGAAIDASPLVVSTAKPPSVVRFRPASGTTSVALAAKLSVRFSEPMDHASTEGAWSVTADGSAVGGTFAWAESDTVLVFTPASAFTNGQAVAMTVGPGATSKAGLVVAAQATASFTTVPKPKAAAKPVPKPSTGGGSTGTSTGAGTWAAVEAYYLTLMNCTRTGGWVTSTGACSSPGGRAVAPLWQDAGISASVSRPYAKKLAVNNLCTHFSGGTPGDRLRAAGYTSYVWAENLGCRSGDPYAAVLGSHLYFQSEASYNGGHYVNLMNAKYDRCGIGVWVYAGRVRLVIDFYHPL